MKALVLVLSTLVIYIHSILCIQNECTFPCLHNNEVCEVTSGYSRCAIKTNTTRWILTSATSVPVFVGNTTAQLGEPCERPPITNTTRTYDPFYGNCARFLYCGLSGVCMPKLHHGEVCESSSQCVHRLVCVNKTCQLNSPSITSSLNTVHIILYTLGTVVIIAIMLFIYIKARHIKNQKRERGGSSMTQIQSSLPTATVLTTSTANPVNQHAVSRILEANFGRDIPSERQLHDKSQAPPPYSP
ncbi:hypothetical protein BCV72DRAFT_276466 [Rhizopus microsporus var. microsporus]|uniref:EB domain-containing protein n=2 Tax=Rhizopus microsporus TaxID=58291 RepID=A0A2G4SQ93_RHIZD|nr:uncharacterized protein RHIMIDRAFT_293154 [Rhizopus microsporus ATCC 52813]ORE05297.1 hypothetical protein BCV72DRAFT_276466 [Rhizopus microsporus var. microsporus]PHZ10949.1 hypothetical protein RHIMIDRAFT_293154 [Rhizopus microsporus ATCC 52813]